MKIYNDTIKYNEPEVAYNGGWFQKEADFAKIGDFLNSHLSITTNDNITLDDNFLKNIDITLSDSIKLHDISQIVTNYSVSLVDKIKVSDNLIQCCFTVILRDNIGIVDHSNQLLFVELKDNIALIAPVVTKCQFKINTSDFLPLSEVMKYGLNGEQIIWQWTDILSDNKSKWSDISHKTSLWIDRNKTTTKYTDRIIPNKF